MASKEKTEAARQARAAARAAKKQDRSDDDADARQRREDPDLRGPKGKGLRVGVGVLMVIVLAVTLLYFALRSAGSRLATASFTGLVPWTGGTGWRVRPGQFIDPAAAESLRLVGLDVDTCNPQPITLDVSRAGGGVFPPHVSHQTGRDVDIRMSDLYGACRVMLQTSLAEHGWRVWYDGVDALAPTPGGRHLSHLHARFGG